jgi:hypothetical protein
MLAFVLKDSLCKAERLGGNPELRQNSRQETGEQEELRWSRRGCARAVEQETVEQERGGCG